MIGPRPTDRCQSARRPLHGTEGPPRCARNADAVARCVLVPAKPRTKPRNSPYSSTTRARIDRRPDIDPVAGKQEAPVGASRPDVVPGLVGRSVRHRKLPEPGVGADPHGPPPGASPPDATPSAARAASRTPMPSTRHLRTSVVLWAGSSCTTVAPSSARAEPEPLRQRGPSRTAAGRSAPPPSRGPSPGQPPAWRGG